MVRMDAAFVRRRMTEQGLTQDALSKSSGLSGPTIRRLLAGKPFTSETLDKIATTLRCHPVDLLDCPDHVDPLTMQAAGPILDGDQVVGAIVGAVKDWLVDHDTESDKEDLR